MSNKNKTNFLFHDLENWGHLKLDLKRNAHQK